MLLFGIGKHIADSIEIGKADAVGRQNIVTFTEFVPVTENDHVGLPALAGSRTKKIVLYPGKDGFIIFGRNQFGAFIALTEEHVAEADADRRYGGNAGGRRLRILRIQHLFLIFGIKGILSPVIGVDAVKAHGCCRCGTAAVPCCKDDCAFIAEVNAYLTQIIEFLLDRFRRAEDVHQSRGAVNGNERLPVNRKVAVFVVKIVFFPVFDNVVAELFGILRQIAGVLPHDCILHHIGILGIQLTGKTVAVARGFDRHCGSAAVPADQFEIDAVFDQPLGFPVGYLCRTLIKHAEVGIQLVERTCVVPTELEAVAPDIAHLDADDAVVIRFDRHRFRHIIGLFVKRIEHKQIVQNHGRIFFRGECNGNTVKRRSGKVTRRQFFAVNAVCDNAGIGVCLYADGLPHIAVVGS